MNLKMSTGDRKRFQDMIVHLGKAIASGRVTPESTELRAIALICDENGLRAESARVRRWLAIGDIHAG